MAVGGGRLEQTGACAGGLLDPAHDALRRAPGDEGGDEEIFGPVLSVLRFSDEAEAVAIANGVEYGLSGSVWTATASGPCGW